jgi:outer membrane cobalamin receptor
VEHQAAVVNPSDSLNAIFTQGGYPGWIYGTIEETRIRELYGKLEWNVSDQLQILGWANFRHSDIRRAGDRTAELEGKELPYFPRLNGYGHLRWKFYKNHKILLSTSYTGTRYDDLANQIKIGDFFLLNTRVDLQLSPNFFFFIAGHNLLDSQYEEFRRFIAPGVTGQLGFRVVM